MAELRSSDVLSRLSHLSRLSYKHMVANLSWSKGSGGGGGASTSDVWLRADATNVQYERVYKFLQQSHNLIVMFQPDVSKNPVFQSTIITKKDISQTTNIIIYFTDENSETLTLTIRPNYTNLSPNKYIAYNETDGKTASIEVLSFSLIGD